MAIYDNQRNPISMNVPSEASAYDRNQMGRNARNVDMNVNDNIENGIGIENNPVLMAARELGLGGLAGSGAAAAARARGQGLGGAADEGIDWFNTGRWVESLGEAVQDLPENLRGMLGWLIPGGIHNPGGGAEEESREVPAIEESLYFNEDIMGG